jgi:predicted DNA-binding transcriptional regulator AlpA
MNTKPILAEMLVGPDAVADLFGVSKQTIARWWKSGMFPSPMRVGRRALRWKVSDLNDFITKENTHGDYSRKSSIGNLADLQDQRPTTTEVR